MVQKLKNLQQTKFSFGKADEYLMKFSDEIDAASMFVLPGWGLGLPDNLPSESKLWLVFITINNENGIFVFNVNGVDLDKAKEGFDNYEEAYGNNMITEWELSIILKNDDYIEKTIFHNGKVELVLTDNKLFYEIR